MDSHDISRHLFVPQSRGDRLAREVSFTPTRTHGFHAPFLSFPYLSSGGRFMAVRLASVPLHGLFKFCLESVNRWVRPHVRTSHTTINFPLWLIPLLFRPIPPPPFSVGFLFQLVILACCSYRLSTLYGSMYDLLAPYLLVHHLYVRSYYSFRACNEVFAFPWISMKQMLW